MFLEPIPFIRRDHVEFLIDVVILEERGYVVRVWRDGIVINDPKQKVFANGDDAFSDGLTWAKEQKC